MGSLTSPLVLNLGSTPGEASGPSIAQVNTELFGANVAANWTAIGVGVLAYTLPWENGFTPAGYTSSLATDYAFGSTCAVNATVSVPPRPTDRINCLSCYIKTFPPAPESSQCRLEFRLTAGPILSIDVDPRTGVLIAKSVGVINPQVQRLVIPLYLGVENVSVYRISFAFDGGGIATGIPRFYPHIAGQPASATIFGGVQLEYSVTTPSPFITPNVAIRGTRIGGQAPRQTTTPNLQQKVLGAGLSPYAVDPWADQDAWLQCDLLAGNTITLPTAPSASLDVPTGSRLLVTQSATAVGGVTTITGAVNSILAPGGIVSPNTTVTFPSANYPNVTQMMLIKTDVLNQWQIIGTSAGGSGASSLSGFVSVFNYMTAAQIADVKARTAALDHTAAVQSAINAGGNLFWPAGDYSVTGVTVPAISFNWQGAGTGGNTTGARLIQRNANQAFILKILGTNPVGGAGFIFGFSISDLTVFAGPGTTTTDAAVIYQNCGLGRTRNFTICNITGTGERYKDSQDIHHHFGYRADLGSNAGAASAILLDTTSVNNNNHIFYIDCHFESLAWTLFDAQNPLDDCLQIVDGKQESRLTCNNIVSLNVAFSLWIVRCSRFWLKNIAHTNVHLFTLPTCDINAVLGAEVSGNKIINALPQASDFVYVHGNTNGYIVKDNSGSNAGIVNDISTGAGYSEQLRLNTLGQSNRFAALDAIAPPIEKCTSNLGGTFVYGSAGSLAGKSITIITNADAVNGIQLPQGFPRGITVHVRLKASAIANTIQMGYRTKAGAYTALRVGVAITTNFADYTIDLTPTMLQTAFEAVVLKEGVGADSLIVDNWTIELTNGFKQSNTLVIGANANVPLGLVSTVSYFQLSHNFGASAFVVCDVNNGIAIINQLGGQFVVGAPAVNQIQLTQAAGQLLGTGAAGGLGGCQFVQTFIQ